jgi:sterol desaturase/sphingolipid hydroxylase (fatty acid hydroxylase superfamily)
VVVVIWLPVAAYSLGRAIVAVSGEAFPVYIPLGFALGLFAWTWVEYTLHRFVFHFRPRNPWQERISFLFHGVHHAQPLSKTRLVMPPAVSIPLALVLYALLRLVARAILGLDQWVAPVFSGLVIGYLAYDMLHYSTHHLRVRWPWFVFLRRYHMHHHTQTPNLRFGVSSPLWDIVFGTKPG